MKCLTVPIPVILITDTVNGKSKISQTRKNWWPKKHRHATRSDWCWPTQPSFVTVDCVSCAIQMYTKWHCVKRIIPLNISEDFPAAFMCDWNQWPFCFVCARAFVSTLTFPRSAQRYFYKINCCDKCTLVNCGENTSEFSSKKTNCFVSRGDSTRSVTGRKQRALDSTSEYTFREWVPVNARSTFKIFECNKQTIRIQFNETQNCRLIDKKPTRQRWRGIFHKKETNSTVSLESASEICKFSMLRTKTEQCVCWAKKCT